MVTVNSFSTQANSGLDHSETTYHFRELAEVRRFIYYICRGNSTIHPIYVNSIAFLHPHTPDTITAEIALFQMLYRKESGLRVRGEVVEISKSELHPDKAYTEICQIADKFGCLFFFQGFQAVYCVFDMGMTFRIIYGINSTSFANGHKYMHNTTTIKDMQMRVLENAVSEVTGKPCKPDIDLCKLEFF